MSEVKTFCFCLACMLRRVKQLDLGAQHEKGRPTSARHAKTGNGPISSAFLFCFKMQQADLQVIGVSKHMLAPPKPAVAQNATHT